MQKNVLCAYVDCYEGDSPLGVFKVSRKKCTKHFFFFLLLKLLLSKKIMKNLEFRVQPHSVTELKSGTHLDQGIVKPPAGKKAGAKRKKGKQLSTTKKSRLCAYEKCMYPCVSRAWGRGMLCEYSSLQLG